jgi:Electron transfer flavoprotein, alpha subunit
MDFSEYKDIYVFAEQRDGQIQSVALELIGKARELSTVTNEKVVAILAGYKIADQAQTLIEYGADKVIVIDDKNLKDYVTEQYTQAVFQAVNEFKPSILMYGATTIGRDLAPRIAARLGTGLTADCTKLAITEDTHELQMTRPAFGGNLMATIMCPNHRPQMSTVRPGVMPKAAPDKARKGEIVEFAPKFDESKFIVKLVKNVKEKKNTVDIADAKILVSGGRGVGCKEGFEMLQGLATVIGGEVSSSRAMVDAGVMPHDRQVGQTGKTVRPAVYFAMGISGAIQHLAGMEESETIIAVNKDKFAPIFSVADLGIVCDLNKVVPLLTERLKKEIKK